jgi:hypothetical protein
VPAATGATRVFRGRTNRRLALDRQDLPDGSDLSTIDAGKNGWERQGKGRTVRVIDYQREGAATTEPFDRLLIHRLDPAQAPAQEAD